MESQVDKSFDHMGSLMKPMMMTLDEDDFEFTRDDFGVMDIEPPL